MIRISTINKKSVVELVTYKKGKAVIVISRVYRFGYVDTEESFEFPDDYSVLNGIDVLSKCSPVDHELSDCCSEEINFHNVTKKDLSAIENSKISLSFVVEEQGFQEFENEWRFFGPLRIEQHG